MSAQRDLIGTIQSQARDLARAVAAVRHWQQVSQADLELAEQAQYAQIDHEYQQTVAQVSADYEKSKDQILAQLLSLEASSGWGELDWGSSRWQSFEPPKRASAPDFVRFGELIREGQFGSITMPALASMQTHNLLFKTAGRGRQRAYSAVEAMILRLLASLPAGGLEFIQITSNKPGPALAGLAAGLPARLLRKSVIHDPLQVEACLLNLEQRLSHPFGQGVESSDFVSPEQSGLAAVDLYQLVVVTDFPDGLTDSALSLLLSLFHKGISVGIHILLFVDTQLPDASHLNLAAYEENASVIVCDETTDKWQDPDFAICRLKLDSLPSAQWLESIFGRIFKTLDLSAQLAENLDLRQLLESATWPKPQALSQAWLGEAVDHKKPVSVLFRRQSNSNLLVIGLQDVTGLVLGTLLGLAAQHAPKSVYFIISALSESRSNLRDHLEAMTAELPHDFSLATQQQVPLMLESIWDQLTERLEDKDAIESRPPLFLFVDGFQLQALKEPVENSGDAMELGQSPVQLLTSICREGPTVNIHVVTWFDSWGALELLLGADADRLFDAQVVGQTKEPDIEESSDSNRADLTEQLCRLLDEDRADHPEEFRPYAVPETGWLHEQCAKLGTRS